MRGPERLQANEDRMTDNSDIPDSIKHLPKAYFTEHDSELTIRSLYKSGYFRDIRLEQDGNVLVVIVQERPAIASIKIQGNDDIETEPLLESLKDIGLAEGNVFDRSLLEKVELELERQYYSRGKYGVKIETTVIDREAYKTQIRNFLTANAPDVNTWYAANRMRPYVEAGLFGVFVDDEYGGIAGDARTMNMCIVTEELSKACGGIALAFAGSALEAIPIDKENQEAIIVIGDTGVGKSTIMSFLAGAQLMVKYDGLKPYLASNNNKIKIGHEKLSETTVPTKAVIQNMAFYDCPGFKDNKG